MLRKSLIAITVMVMGMTGGMLYGVAFGAGRGKSATYTTYEVSQDEIFLDIKRKDYVLADEMRFEVTSSTVIKNGFGKDITLEELRVPCKTIMKYYRKSDKNDSYIAVSIEEVLIPE